MLRRIAASLVLLSVSFSTWASPDILVQARFAPDWTEGFLNRFRQFVVQRGVSDPYVGTFAPINYDFQVLTTGLPQEQQDFLHDIERLLGVDFFRSRYNVTLSGLNYEFANFNADIKPTLSSPQRMEWVTRHEVRGMKLATKDISLNIELGTQTAQPIRFALKIVKPTLSLAAFQNVPLRLDWVTQLRQQDMLVSLNQVDILQAIEMLSRDPDKVELSYEDIVIPQISFEIGSRRINIDPVKVRAALDERAESLKRLMLELLVLKFRDELVDLMGEENQEIVIPRQTLVDSSVKAHFRLERMRMNSSHHAILEIASRFCSKNATHCPQEAPAPTHDERQTVQQMGQSETMITQALNNRESHLVLSLSERYINQLLTTFMKEGLLDEVLAREQLQLGDKLAFVRTTSTGHVFHLYLDLINRVTGPDRILIGRSQLRFPVKLGISLIATKHGNIPKLELKVVELLTTEEMILRGLPELGLTSNVGTIPRFRARVLSRITDSLRAFDGKLLVELELPEFKDIFPETFVFKADGVGRANAMIKLQ